MLLVKDFSELLRTCGWSEDEIDLLLSEVNCINGYIYYDGQLIFFTTFEMTFVAHRYGQSVLGPGGHPAGTTIKSTKAKEQENDLVLLVTIEINKSDGRTSS